MSIKRLRKWMNEWLNEEMKVMHINFPHSSDSSSHFTFYFFILLYKNSGSIFFIWFNAEQNEQYIMKSVNVSVFFFLHFLISCFIFYIFQISFLLCHLLFHVFSSCLIIVYLLTYLISHLSDYIFCILFCFLIFYAVIILSCSDLVTLSCVVCILFHLYRLKSVLILGGYVVLEISVVVVVKW